MGKYKDKHGKSWFGNLWRSVVGANSSTSNTNTDLNGTGTTGDLVGSITSELNNQNTGSEGTKPKWWESLLNAGVNLINSGATVLKDGVPVKTSVAPSSMMGLAAVLIGVVLFIYLIFKKKKYGR